MIPQQVVGGLSTSANLAQPLPRGPMPGSEGYLDPFTMPTQNLGGIRPGELGDKDWGKIGSSLMKGDVASADSMLKPDEGIGLMGTLGILNLGAGLGGQIFKMVTSRRPKPARRRTAVPMPGGNPMR